MIGREKEQRILFDCMNSGRPEFMAVYGRRWVGKTFLIKEYFHGTFSFYATGVPGTNTRQQLKFFHDSLKLYRGARDAKEMLEKHDAHSTFLLRIVLF